MESTISDLTVRLYTELPFAEKTELRKIWHHAVQIDTRCIGWLPTKAFTTRSENGEVVAVHRNGDCVGWAMFSHSHHRGVGKVYQIWVRPDARVLEHGRALIHKILELPATKLCWQLEAWVAEDLEANVFWKAIGFWRNNWRWGGGTTPRKIYRWTYPLTLFAENYNERISGRFTQRKTTDHGVAKVGRN